MALLIQNRCHNDGHRQSRGSEGSCDARSLPPRVRAHPRRRPLRRIGGAMSESAMKSMYTPNHAVTLNGVFDEPCVPVEWRDHMGA